MEINENFAALIERVGGFRSISSIKNKNIFYDFCLWFKSTFGREPYSHNDHDVNLLKAYVAGSRSPVSDF